MQELLTLAQSRGYLTTADVVARGVPRMTLTRLAASGHLLDAGYGVYLPSDDRTPTQRYVSVTQSWLDRDPWTAASHQSALALHDISLWGMSFQQVHLADPRCSSRRHKAIHRHVLRNGDDVVRIDGRRVLALPLALCLATARSGMVPGVVAIDNALHRDLCTKDDLQAIVDSGRLRVGIGAVREALKLADPKAGSAGESRLRTILVTSPFTVESQVNVGGPGSGYLLDFLVDGCVAVEFDGASKYDGADGKAAVIAEKRREDWIRGRGLGFMRVMWPELDYPVTLKRTLHQRVVEARAARFGRPIAS